MMILRGTVGANSKRLRYISEGNDEYTGRMIMLGTCILSDFLGSIDGIARIF